MVKTRKLQWGRARRALQLFLGKIEVDNPILRPCHSSLNAFQRFWAVQDNLIARLPI